MRREKQQENKDCNYDEFDPKAFDWMKDIAWSVYRIASSGFLLSACLQYGRTRMT